MTIKYKIIPIITIIIFIIIFIFSKSKYNKGSKITNLDFLQKSKYYKSKIIQYTIIKITIIILLFISVIQVSLLLSKPISITKSSSNNNVILCMDVSSSTDNLNLEIIDNLKEVIDKSNNNYGITIFNTSAVTLSPITADKDYNKETLDKIKNSIIMNNSNNSNNLYIRDYIISGTLNERDERNTSLIGDGLLSCINEYNNSYQNKNIILITDNKVSGKEILSREDALKIAKKNNIKVYNISNNNLQHISNQINKNSKKINNYNEDPTIIFIILFTTTSLFILVKKVFIWVLYPLYQYQ